MNDKEILCLGTHMNSTLYNYLMWKTTDIFSRQHVSLILLEKLSMCFEGLSQPTSASILTLLQDY